MEKVAPLECKLGSTKGYKAASIHYYVATRDDPRPAFLAQKSIQQSKGMWIHPGRFPDLPVVIPLETAE